MMSDGQRKAPSSTNNLNSDLCEFLTELAGYERNVTRNIFKSNAYRSAASALAAHPTRITGGKEASAIKGIGKKIAEKIDEFLTTGKLKKLEKIRADDTSTALTELTRVSGVGPAKARQLYDAGITDLEALRQRQDLLTHHQVIGLKYLEDFEKRIPRAEVQSIEGAIRRSLATLQKQYIVTICGSYRRGSEKSGDVDVLLTYSKNTSQDEQEEKKVTVESKNKKRKDMSDSSSDEGAKPKKSRQDIESRSSKPNDCEEDMAAASSSDTTSSSSSKTKVLHRTMLLQVVEQLQRDSVITDTLSQGDTKFMGVCLAPEGKLHRRLDIRLLAPEHYHCGVLYFTGSDLFNKEMRTKALAAGFTLNEYSIRPLGSTGVAGEPLPVTSERDVFEYIGMEYKKPEDRNM